MLRLLWALVVLALGCSLLSPGVHTGEVTADTLNQQSGLLTLITTQYLPWTLVVLMVVSQLIQKWGEIARDRAALQRDRITAESVERSRESVMELVRVFTAYLEKTLESNDKALERIADIAETESRDSGGTEGTPNP